MESNSESNRETCEGFAGNAPFEEKNEQTHFCSTKKLIAIIILSIIIISIIIVIIILLTSNSEKEVLITCEPGYYLPEDDKSQCLPCSENCK